MNQNELTYFSDKINCYGNRYDMLQGILNGRDTVTSARYFKTEYFDYGSFTRDPTMDLDVESKIALSALRDKYKKLALYYSGGLDSHFVLKQMIQHKIFPDKIVVMVDETIPGNFAFTPGNETKYAWRRLVEYRRDGLIPSSVKLEKMVITPKMALEFFSSDRFWELSCPFYNNIATIRSNALVECLEIDKDYQMLYGQTSPNIYWDADLSQWTVAYVDLTLDLNFASPNLTVFNMHDRRIMEAHLNSVINELEKESDYETKYTLASSNKLPTKHVFRNKIPQYKAANEDLEFSFLFPKFNIVDKPINDIVDYSNSISFKAFTGYIMAQLTRPEWFEVYLERANEAKIREMMELNSSIGGILMKPILVK